MVKRDLKARNSLNKFWQSRYNHLDQYLHETSNNGNSSTNTKEGLPVVDFEDIEGFG